MCKFSGKSEKKYVLVTKAKQGGEYIHFFNLFSLLDQNMKFYPIFLKIHTWVDILWPIRNIMSNIDFGH